MNDQVEEHSLPSELEVFDLILDPFNPRLPEDMRGEDDQDELLEFVAEEYDSLTVAQSIASHGYFASEPLIVLLPEQGDNRYVVMEGNRRLAALKLLKDAELRGRVDLWREDRWEELAEQASDLSDLVPVVAVKDRREVAPIVGYRHISGIEPWDPWAKARFIVTLLDDHDLDFDEAADEVGEDTSSVQANYRNYRVIQRAREAGIPTKGAEKSFGVFTRAMQGKLREHIGAPVPSDVEKDGDVIPQDRTDELAELLEMLFGSDSRLSVISDSRDIGRLARVVGDEDGLKVLRETWNLEEAYISAGGIKDRLLRRLRGARTHLEAASDDIIAYPDDPEVVDAVKACKAALDELVTHAEL